MPDPWNAVVTAIDDEPAAAGPLAGWRIGVKDNIAVAGVRSTRGSAFFADHVPEDDAEVVRRLRAAGAGVVATLNMAEFALGVTSQNSVHGGVRNPRDAARIPGGSSGGSGAAVAAGLFDVGHGAKRSWTIDAALGTDTGGSVRLPASMCGVTGLRPTHGTVPEDGVFPCCPETDATGPLTRTAADAALIAAVLAGREPRPTIPVAPAVVGIVEFPALVDSGVARRVHEAVQTFAAAGSEVRRVRIAAFDTVRDDLYTVVYHDLAALHAERLREPARFQPDTLTRIRLGLDITPDDRAAALARMDAFRRAVADALDGVDLLLTPTVPVDVPPIASGPGDPGVLALTRRVGELTAPWAVHQGPTLTIPAGEHPVSGMPVGMQLTGRVGDDDAVCAAGAWFQERPARDTAR